MGHIITDLKENFKRGNIYIQLIYINGGVFIFTSLLMIFLKLFNRSGENILFYAEMPASLQNFLYQPWSIFTYMFMHGGVMHILFNMLWLYWFGQLFLCFFSAKHLRGLYVLGGICGAILYMLSFNLFPYFSNAIESSYMLGASASVLAIVIATAYRQPDYQVRLLLFGTVRLKYIALVMILSDLFFVTSDNAGGHIAHLGGALAGLWFAASLSKGHDVTAWINKILDWIISLFTGKVFTNRRKPKMTVHYGGDSRKKDYDYNAKKKAQSDEVDRILDKLKKSGYESLTTEEKKSLFDASKK
jgi:membrane associated rhomboid family serine protease